MASLPGVPGNLGLPPSGDPANPAGGGNSDHTTDVGSQSGTIALEHKVITAELQGSASGSIAIPSTGGNNLIVVLATMTLGSAQHPVLTITDNASDSFQHPAWNTLATTDAGFGEMFRYSGGNGGLHYYDDCAYAQTAGGATAISWSLTNAGSAGAVSIEFFIYELSGYTSWLLRDYQGTGVSNAVLDSTNYPYEGPSVTGAADENDAFFTTCNIAFEFFPEISLGAVVDAAWALDNPNGGTNAAVSMLNVNGVQQCEFRRQSPFQINNSEIGVVFGPGPGSGGGGGTPPPDTDTALPNVWIVS